MVSDVARRDPRSGKISYGPHVQRKTTVFQGNRESAECDIHKDDIVSFCVGTGMIKGVQ